MTIAPITVDVIEKAIDLRAQHPALKTPDALHLATGILTAYTAFVTRDAAWAKVGVTVIDPIDL